MSPFPIAATIGIFALILSAQAQAQGQVVVTTLADELDDDADPGNGSGTSLREAIIFSDPDSTITFEGELSGETIVFTSEMLIEDQAITVDASSLPGGITLSGDDSTRLFQLTSSTELTLCSLTLAEGNAGTSDGGAIDNEGNLTMKACTIRDCTASSAGAIANTGTVLLQDCTLHSQPREASLVVSPATTLLGRLHDRELHCQRQHLTRGWWHQECGGRRLFGQYHSRWKRKSTLEGSFHRRHEQPHHGRTAPCPPWPLWRPYPDNAPIGELSSHPHKRPLPPSAPTNAASSSMVRLPSARSNAGLFSRSRILSIVEMTPCALRLPLSPPPPIPVPSSVSMPALLMARSLTSSP